MAKALLYDATLCIGCLTCEEACATKNKLRYDEGVKGEKKTSDPVSYTHLTLPTICSV